MFLGRNRCKKNRRRTCLTALFKKKKFHSGNEREGREGGEAWLAAREEGRGGSCPF